ncbi:MAG: hypothetical protein UEE41_02810 [Acutalibacteraceae bacterium]|nr:hypothetical protein [Acutalibacteraceae bacterium]
MGFISKSTQEQITKEISKAALPALNKQEREHAQRIASILSAQQKTILHFNEKIEQAQDEDTKEQLRLELQYSLSMYDTQIKQLSRT